MGERAQQRVVAVEDFAAALTHAVEVPAVERGVGEA